MTDEEFIAQKREELRSVRAKCSQYCPFYDHQDHDCDRYGQNHPSPSRCAVFLIDCLTEWKSKKEEENG